MFPFLVPIVFPFVVPITRRPQRCCANRDFIAATPFTGAPDGVHRYCYGNGPYPDGDAVTLRAMIGARQCGFKLREPVLGGNRNIVGLVEHRRSPSHEAIPIGRAQKAACWRSESMSPCRDGMGNGYAPAAITPSRFFIAR